MKIRQLTADDADVYQELRLFGLQESPRAFGASYDEEVDRPLEVVAERLRDGRNYVVGAFGDDGQLAGIATLRREHRQKLRHKASVVGMYVQPEYRGQGAGRALLEAAIARARELGVRLFVLTALTGRDEVTGPVGAAQPRVMRLLRWRAVLLGEL